MGKSHKISLPWVFFDTSLYKTTELSHGIKWHQIPTSCTFRAKVRWGFLREKQSIKRQFNKVKNIVKKIIRSDNF